MKTGINTAQKQEKIIKQTNNILEEEKQNYKKMSGVTNTVVVENIVLENSVKVPALANVLTAMQANGERILRENCKTREPKPIHKRQIVLRKKEIFRNITPAPITCVVRERCQTPDQIVDATVSTFV